ncbi:MAG TPA: hypothetical protein VFO70_03310 [Chitinophagaceae bacterium]|nr:hypothetical protein [Chitinophagaceae bacterium]
MPSTVNRTHGIGLKKKVLFWFVKMVLKKYHPPSVKKKQPFPPGDSRERWHFQRSSQKI